MRKLAILAAILALTSTPALAERDRGAHHMDRLAEKLQLSEEQSSTVASIMREQHEKAHAIMKDCKEQKRAEMDAVHEETKQRLADILSAEQLQQLEDMRNERHQRWRDRKEHRGGAGES